MRYQSKTPPRFLRWIAAAWILAVLLSVSGCGLTRDGSTDEEEPQTLQSETTKVVRVLESETEGQVLITSVDYTSKDGTVKITLPDNTWKVTQDTDELRVFASGNTAMINIGHAVTEAAMKTLPVQTSKMALDAALTKQYADSSAYEIQSFDNQLVEGDIHIYRYVVRYNAAARMWAYSVTYGIVAPSQAYVITGTVTDDNQDLLKSVETSVDSFTVLQDEKLSSLTGSAGSSTIGAIGIAGAGSIALGTTAQTTTASTDNSVNESQSLSQYSAVTTLYASDVVNVRQGPGTDTTVIDALETGDAVMVTGETSDWYQVFLNGNYGYIRKDFLRTSSGGRPEAQVMAETTTQTPGQTTQTDAASSGAQMGSAAAEAEVATASNYSSASILYATDGVNVRAQPGTDSAVIGSLNAGNAVTVIGETDNWYIVSTGTGTGYISKSYLSASGGTQSEPQAQSQPQGQEQSASIDDSGTSVYNGSDTSSSTGNPTVDANAYHVEEQPAQSAVSTPTSGISTISGTVTSASGSTLVIAGSDGNTYTIDTMEADISTSSGLTTGLPVSVTVDYAETASDGTLYATNVSGN